MYNVVKFLHDFRIFSVLVQNYVYYRMNRLFLFMHLSYRNELFCLELIIFTNLCIIRDWLIVYWLDISGKYLCIFRMRTISTVSKKIYRHEVEMVQQGKQTLTAMDKDREFGLVGRENN